MKKEELMANLKIWKARLLMQLPPPKTMWNEGDEGAYNQIVAILKKEVSEEWVLERERRLAHYALGLTAKEANMEIRAILKELGYEVK